MSNRNFKVKQRICLVCGKQFAARSFDWLGRTVWATIHVECEETSKGCADRSAKLKPFNEERRNKIVTTDWDD